MSMVLPPSARRLAATLRADLPGLAGAPRLARFLLAAVTAVVLSLVACAVVAAATRALVPALAGYGHLAVQDWAKLTVIGVVLASLGCRSRV